MLIQIYQATMDNDCVLPTQVCRRGQQNRIEKMFWSVQKLHLFLDEMIVACS